MSFWWSNVVVSKKNPTISLLSSKASPAWYLGSTWDRLGSLCGGCFVIFGGGWIGLEEMRRKVELHLVLDSLSTLESFVKMEKLARFNMVVKIELTTSGASSSCCAVSIKLIFWLLSSNFQHFSTIRNLHVNFPNS